jgi:hypothetical protein
MGLAGRTAVAALGGQAGSASSPGGLQLREITQTTQVAAPRGSRPAAAGGGGGDMPTEVAALGSRQQQRVDEKTATAGVAQAMAQLSMDDRFHVDRVVARSPPAADEKEQQQPPSSSPGRSGRDGFRQKHNMSIQTSPPQTEHQGGTGSGKPARYPGAPPASSGAPGSASAASAARRLVDSEDLTPRRPDQEPRYDARCVRFQTPRMLRSLNSCIRFRAAAALLGYATWWCPLPLPAAAAVPASPG